MAAVRVLQGVIDVAGQTGLTTHGLREIGVDAHAYFAPNPFGYEMAPDSAPSGRIRIERTLRRAATFARFARWYDVFHFHAGITFSPGFLRHADARLLKRLGRKVAVEFWGSEIRIASLDRERNPYFVGGDDRDEEKRAFLEEWAAITDGHVIASDHSFDIFLRPYFDEIHVVGQRIDTQRLSPTYPAPDVRRPLLVHAPSRLEIKGTKYVRAAVERLRAQGLPFEYIEVHGYSHPEALEIYRRADLIVDQLCVGSYGVFAIEAMSLGKPVLCYVLPELVPRYPEGFPIINANPDSIASVLEDWLQNPEERHRRGIQSRRYAERVHDCRGVARKLMQVYDLI